MLSGLGPEYDGQVLCGWGGGIYAGEKRGGKEKENRHKARESLDKEKNVLRDRQVEKLFPQGLEN